MSKKEIDISTIALAAAVVFGRGKDINEIEFMMKVYEALLVLRDEFGDDIDEFDLIRALEELPGFRPRDILRNIANNLHMLERHGQGLLKLKTNLYLDDYLPGDQPASISKVPVDFLRIKKDESIFQKTATKTFDQLIPQFLSGVKKIFQTTREVGISPMTPFFQLKKSGEDHRLIYNGTGPATTPFVDIYLVLTDILERFPEYSEKAANLLKEQAPSWIEQYLNLIVKPEQTRETMDIGAIRLFDDDDYPGASKPATLTNADFIALLAKEQARRLNEEQPPLDNLKEIVAGLTRFLLRSQNPGGGWPIYRFGQTCFPQARVPSVVLFSSVTFAGLLDALDILAGDPLEEEILSAMAQYRDLVVTSVQEVSPESVAWAPEFERDEEPDIGDTASNIQACALLSLIFQDSRDVLIDLGKKAANYIGEYWKVDPDPKKNIYQVPFRPPTENGPAMLPVNWEQSLLAKVLRALSQAYILGIDPGFKAAKKMEMAAMVLSEACTDGFWMDLNSDTMINVSTGATSARALVYYQAALKKAEG